MQRNPFLIVKEYLQPSEPAQVRKNALTALAVLEDPDSLALLADVALVETDPEVRDKAEAEIVALPPQSAAAALQPALNDLTRPGREQNAYGLLGRLRNRGIHFKFPGLSLLTRLRLAGSMRNQLYPQRGFMFWFRTFWGVTTGALFAWALVIVLATGPYDLHMEGTSVVGYLLAGWGIGLIVSIAATTHTIPARYHADPTGGALFDMVRAAVLALPLAAWAAFQFKTGVPEDNHTMPLFFLVPAGAAAVRTGTLAAFGVLRGGIQNRVLQVAVGGMCGTAVYEWGAIAAGRIGDPLYGSSWLLVMIVSFALAGAYAWIDSRSSCKPVTVPAIRWLSLVFTAAGVGALLLPLIRLPHERHDFGKVAPPWAQSVEIRHLPTEIVFQTVSRSSYDVRTSDYRNYATRLEQWDDAGRQWTKPTEAASNLSPGQYRIVIEHNSTDKSAFAALPELPKLMEWPQIDARMKRTVPITGVPLETVTPSLQPVVIYTAPARRPTR
jgi:hypothetical protein